MNQPVRSATSLLRTIQAIRSAQFRSESLGVPVALVLPSNSTTLMWARLLGPCLAMHEGTSWDGQVLSAEASEVLVSSERGVVPSGVPIDLCGWDDGLNADGARIKGLLSRCP